jgi:hypothetical protein
MCVVSLPQPPASVGISGIVLGPEAATSLFCALALRSGITHLPEPLKSSTEQNPNRYRSGALYTHSDAPSYYPTHISLSYQEPLYPTHFDTDTEPIAVFPKPTTSTSEKLNCCRH